MAKVEVYTTTFCPFCVRAKSLLKQKGVAFEEIDVGADSELRAAMIERAGGRRTVPEISSMAKLSAATTTSRRSMTRAASTPC